MPRRELLIETCEDRILCSTTVPLDKPPEAGKDPSVTAVTAPDPAASTEAPAPPPAGASAVSAAPHADAKVVLIDAKLADSNTLVQAATAAGSQVFLYDSANDTATDVLQRVVAWAGTNNTRLEDVAILSHGVGGAFELGNQWVTASSLADTQAAWQQLSTVLSAGAKIELFGCDVAAAGSAGQQLLDGIAGITHARVFASTDTTGVGGNWILEAASAGAVASALPATAVPLDQTVLGRYAGVLGTIAIDNTTSTTANATSVTWSLAVNSGSNRLLVVDVAIRTSGASETVTSVTYGGVALTKLGAAAVAGQVDSEMWYLLAPTVGTANVTVTVSAARKFSAGATDYFGVDQATPFGTFVAASAKTAAASVTVSSATGDLVIDSLSTQGDAIPLSPGGGQTQIWSNTTGNAGGDTLGAGSSEAGAASVTMSWGLGKIDNWALGAVSVHGLFSAAPVVTLPGAAINYTENDPATVLDGSATVTDSDSPNFAGGTLTVDFSANGTANDRLAINNQGVGAGQIGVSGANVTYGGTVIGTFTGGTGTTPLVVTFNNQATPAVAQALVRNITFANVSDAPSTLARTVRFVVDDGGGGVSAAVTKTVNVTAVNDAPRIDDATFSIQANSPNGTAVTNINDFLTGTDFDVDGQALTYSITGGNTGTAFAINAATGAITVNSSAALNYLTNPTFTLTVQASDGSLTDTAAITIDLIPGPIDGSVGSVAVAVGNKLYAVNLTTGKGTLLYTDPSIATINSVGYDSTNGIYYFVDSSGATNSIYGWDARNGGARFTVVADVTTMGVSLAGTSLAAAGGDFNGGSYYFSTEGGGPSSEDQLYKADFLAGSSGRTISSITLISDTGIPGANEFGDFIVNSAAGKFYSFNSGTGVVEYNIVTSGTPSLTLVQTDSDTGVAQSAYDRFGTMYAISNTIRSYNPAGAGTFGAARTMTTDGTTALGSAADGGAYISADASIGDRVWYDTNSNGLQDGSETGVTGLTVTLYYDLNGDGIINGSDSAIATTTTGVDGAYDFSYLLPDTYIVKVTDPTNILNGGTSTTGGTTQAASITLVGQTITSKDFGFQDNRPALSVTNTTINEAAGYATFTVSLSRTYSLSLTVDLALANGTATGGGTDYGTAGAGNLQVFNGASWVDATSATFAAGATSVQVRTPITNDALYENSETFTLTATRTTTAISNVSASGTGTIKDDGTGTGGTNDDRPAFSINDVTVNEGAGTASFTVTRTGDTTLASTVDYATAGNTATSGTDFTAATGTLNFAAGVGSMTVTLPVTIANDTVYEGSETFFVNLSNATNATIADTQGIGTIMDDGTGTGGTNDDRPVYTINDVTRNEGDATMSFTVTLTGDTNLASTIAYATANNTATAGADFTTTSGTLSFAAGTGVRTQTVTVPILNDSVYEQSETFFLNLSAATNATIGDAQGIGTIKDDGTGGTATDDDRPVYTVNDVTRNEGDGTMSFTVALTGDTNLASTINYATANNTATAGADYTTTSGTLSFAAGTGVRTQTVTVPILNDSVYEQSETFFLNLSAASNATIGDAQGIGTIKDDGTGGVATDDDRPVYTVNDMTRNEGDGTMTFTVTLTGDTNLASTINYATANNTATAGADYTTTSGTLSFAAGVGVRTQTVTVPILNDSIYEQSERFFLNLTGATNATIGDAQGVGTIKDDGTGGTATDDDRPVYTINDVTRNEGDGTMSFTVTLTGDTNLASTINYATANNTATAGADYTTTSGTLNFAAGVGVRTQTVTVPILNDSVYEQSETFFLNLSGATNATIGDAQGIGTIKDDGTGGVATDDDRPVYTVNDVTRNEGDGTMSFTVTLTGDTNLASTINYATANNTATAGADYTSTSGTLNFAAGVGVRTQTVTVPILNDSVYEQSETFFLNLSAATNATIGDAQGIGTIRDDGTGGTATDDDRPVYTVSDITRNEGDGTMVFTVTLTGDTNLASTINYATASNTATAGADYTTTSGTLSFAAGVGVRTQTVTVPILNDSVYEQSETFFLNLSGATDATIGDAQGVGTIKDDGTGGTATDDDRPAFSINDVTVNEGAGMATFTVSLSNQSTTDVSFSLALVNGTALGGGSDYGTSGAGNLQVFNGTSWVDAASATIAAGQTSVQVRTPITDDTLAEPTEAFTLAATVTSGTTTNPSAIGTATITDNDGTPTITINDVTRNEAAGTITFTVSLSALSALAVSVDYTAADGTATSADYAAGVDPLSGTLNFAAGVTSQTITLAITNDTIFELSEDFTINLTNAVNATIGDAQGIGTIKDDGTGGGGTNDDRPAFSINDVTVNEGAGTATFTVTRTGDTNLASTVDYATASGTATSGADFTAATGTLNFAAGVGAMTVTLPVTITNDTVYEGSETFFVNLSNATNATIADTQGIGTIKDDGTGTGGTNDDRPAFSINDVTVNEGAGTATFTVTRTGDTNLASTVDYATASGTATSGADFTSATGTLTFAAGVGSMTMTLPVTITNDTVFESSETFFVNLSNATNATISDTQGIGTIKDDGTGTGGTNDDRPAFSINDVTVNEGAGTASFTVTRTGDTNLASTVDYATASGTATSGADFTAATGTLNFAAGVGAMTVTLPVSITNDTVFEGSETFVVNLSNATNATIADAQGIGTIKDDGTGTGGTNDDTPSLSVPNITVTEGTDPYAVFTVQLSNTSTTAVSVDLALANGTALGAGTDYGAGLEVSTNGGATWSAGTSATIAAGQTSVLVRTPINDDALNEAPETFTLTATVTAGTTVNASSTGTATISDNDPAPSLVINDVTVNEGAGTATFTVTLSAPSGQTVTVDYATAASTATAGADYTTTTGTLTFTAGVTTQTVSVPIINDTIFEGGETFNVVLATAVNATISDATGLGTILDDGTGTGGTDNDTPSLSVTNPTVVEGTDPYAAFTVSLGNASTTDVSFNLALANGSALGAGSDYGTSGAGNLQVFNGVSWVDATSATIAAGQTSVQVRTPITNDALAEAIEDFTLTATVTAGTTSNPSATGTATVVDDDGAPALLINDVTVNEGAGTMTFTVSLTSPSGLGISVNYATAAGTATAGADYTTKSGTLNFAAGETSKTVTVSILNDTIFEQSEAFSVNLSGAVNATIADGTGVGTILDAGNGPGGTDDDTPALAVNNVTVTEGTDNYAQFTVSLSNASTTPVSFNLALADGSATGTGTDYGTAGAGNLQVFNGVSWVDATSATIAAGQTSVLVRTAITNDVLNEAAETFTLTATRSSGVTSNASATGTGTIDDNDAAPALSINDVTVNEAAGTATFTVTLSAASGQTVTVDYATSDGTATNADYTPTTGTLTFAPGATSHTITVAILNDTIFENSEAFNVNLSNAVNATISDNVGVGTIKDDGTGAGGTDNDTPTLAVSSVSATEGADNFAVFTVSLTNASATPVSFNLALADGSATGGGTDYGTAGAGNLQVFDGVSWVDATSATIAAGQTSVQVRTPITNDLLNEATETFTLTATRTAGTTTNASAAGTGTIVDNDAAPTLAINDVTVNEATGTATFTVSLSAPSGQAVSVNYATSSGTATTGLDFLSGTGTLNFTPGVTSQSVTVSILNDAIFENSEAFNVTLSAPTNATIADGLGIGTIKDDGTGTGGTDNDTPTLSVSDLNVTEGTDGFAVFTVSLSNLSTTDVGINLALADGTAFGAGSDFGTAGAGNLQVSTDGISWVDATTATIAAGQASVFVRTPIANDALAEAIETFTLTATRTSGSTTNASATGTATIADDDGAPTLSINDVTVNEGAGTATFTVRLSGPSGLAVDVNYTTNSGTATAGADFTTNSGALSFAPGVTSQSVTVSILNDAIFENSENFTVTLSGAVNAAIADPTGVGTILDNGTGAGGTDDDTPALSIADVAVTEGTDPYAVFSVALSNASTTTVSVSLALANGTALGGGTDFGTSGAGNLQVSTDGGTSWADATTATFAPGKIEVLVRTPITNDALDEAAENFTLTAAVTSGTTSNSSAIGTATIADNDPAPALSIDNVTLNEAAGTTTFTVSLSAPSGQSVSVNYATNDGTATAGADFTGSSGLLTFAPGATSQTISIAITNDTIFEHSENFTVVLSGAVNATIADDTGVGTILDDGTGTGGTDNDTPSVTVSNVTVTEGTDSFAVFAVNLSNRSTTPVSVSLALADGTATGGGVDYGAGLEVSTDGGSTWTPTNVATIAAGTDGVLVRTPIPNDLLNEPTEDFTLTATVTAGTTVNANATGTATILDNDPTPTLTIDDVIVNEGAGTITFTVNLSAASGQTVTVNYATSDGTATAADYTGGSGTLTFVPSVIGQSITLPITNDTIFENSENFTVTLSGAVNAVIADNLGVGTIKDDGTGQGGADNDTPTLSVNNVAVTEGTDPFAVFSVDLSNPSTTPVTVGLSLADGSALGSGTDYGAAGATNLQVSTDNGTTWTNAASATIAAGKTSVLVRTPIINDTLHENTETFTLTATKTAGTTTNASVVATGTINDNDPAPGITINDVTVNEAAGTATFTVRLSTASGLSASVDYATGGGTATSGVDFTGVSGTLNFAAGQTTQTITVPILNDAVYEGSETFNVNLSNAVGATLTDNLGVGTINDDGTGTGGTDNDKPTLSVSNVTVTEGVETHAQFSVSLSNAAATPITLDLALADGTANGGGSDYGTTGAGNLQVSTDGGSTWADATSVTLPPGRTSVLVRTPITADAITEPVENFTLTATVTSGPTTNPSAVGTAALNDDPPAPVPAPPLPEPVPPPAPVPPVIEYPPTFAYEYDVFHNFSTEEIKPGAPLRPFLPPALKPIDVAGPAILPLAPIYAGEADPGATLVIEIYNANGVRIGSQTVLADAGGNWLANFATTTMKDAPSDVRITQVSAPYSFGGTAGHNLRTYYSPTAINPGHFLSQTIKNSLLSEAAPLLGGLDLANPIQLGPVKYGAEMLPSEGVASGD